MQSLLLLREEYPVVQLSLSIAAFVLYLVSRRLVQRGVVKRTLLHSFDLTRATYIRKAISYLLFVGFLVVVGIIWEVSLRGLSVYIASFLTIIGIGFFATWSILSNITAAVILFFFFPIKIGSKVKVNDGENSAEGTVKDLSLFSITIVREDGKEVYYPNNVAIQKSISRMPDHE